MARPKKSRRGIVILVVLSLLVLFVLLAVTFAVVAGHYNRAAKANAREELLKIDERRALDMAMYQLLRGPKDGRSSSTDVLSRSVIWGHDLLRDLYGVDYETTWVANARIPAVSSGTQPPKGQVLVLRLSSSLSEPLEGYYGGRVFTILDGDAAGISTRILAYLPTSQELVIEMPKSDSATVASALATNPNNVLGSKKCLINGAPFNGRGYGYQSSTGNLTEVDPLPPPATPPETALTPNYAAYRTASSGGDAAPGGDADEGCDVADYRDMFLACVPPNATQGNQIIPSFHRPALINYWLNNGAYGQTASADLLRRITLRPLPLQGVHPNFSGSNSAIAFNTTIDPNDDNQMIELLKVLVRGPWDVDNDGDGLRDSVWLDLQLPVRTAKDGRKYRPLVAILCRDLDGLLNVNAAGSLYQQANVFSQQLADTSLATATVGAPITLPRGRGAGPPEINLSQIYGTDYTQLLMDRYRSSESFDYHPGSRGFLNPADPNGHSRDDRLIRAAQIGLPERYGSTAAAYVSKWGSYNDPSGYGSYPDSIGRGVVALDHTGQPWVWYSGTDANFTLTNPFTSGNTQYDVNERLDSPYQLNLVEPSGKDRPFTIHELERHLRRRDSDRGTLPDRLTDITPSDAPITTHSYDIPTPAGVPLDDEGMSSVSELMYTKLADPAHGLTTSQIAAQLRLMVPFELLRGQKMDINRPWGNGWDNSSGATKDYVVDDPAELANNENVFSDIGSGTTARYQNDYPGATSAFWGRQIYARHLYCLMMALTGNDDDPRDALLNPYRHPTEESLSTAQQRKLTAQRIAQWAINVVDFRDPDAIMTPFEYDENPFDGWTVDGDPRDKGNDGQDNDSDGSTDEPDEAETDRGLVWGCEAPELLITECLAFHDRRVKDTDLDSSGLDRSSTPNPDPTLDQYRIPQGSLFVEFYCPRSRNEINPIAPRELYDINTTTGEYALNLAKMAPASSPPSGARRMPVWRVAISEQHLSGGGGPTSPTSLRTAEPDSTTFEPEDMGFLSASGSPDELELERFIWFSTVDPTTVGLPASEAQLVYWNRSGATRALLKPASYAVIGPRATTRVGSQIPAAPATPPDYLPSEQRIELTATGLQVYSTTGAVMPPAPPAIKAAQTMVVAANPPATWTNAGTTAPMGIGVSVTEPVPGAAYYDEPTYRLSAANGFPFDGYYDYDNSVGPFPDDPFDSDPGMPLTDDGILETETSMDYKTAFLQRLANPLLPWNPPPKDLSHTTDPNHDPSRAVNPYITVDWMSIDVTVFNGEDDDSGWGGGGAFDPDDPNPDEPHFETRERGLASESQNLWTIATDNIAQSGSNGSDDYFDYSLIQTLGHLNQTFGTKITPGAANAEYNGAPESPFPWLSWNNRPFVNPMELLQVPASTPARLFHEYNTTTPDNPYLTTDHLTFRAPFPHLLNFFHSTRSGTEGGNFFRLLDLVEVPSGFAGTQTWYNPAAFQPTADASYNNYMRTFRPPFNKLSRFRDPGRVNINTIFSDPNPSGTSICRTWEALTYGFPRGNSTTANHWDDIDIWENIRDSRRGFDIPQTVTTTPPTAATDPPLNFNASLNSDYPTRFAGVFRPAANAGLGPIPEVQQDGVEATLLRSTDPTTPATPLLEVDSATYTTVLSDHRNQDRNPYFYYQGMQRLYNLLTTHSNVYAVWITVGFFEVEEAQDSLGNELGPSLIHPDGYALGQELGLDTGTVKRHRAFYVIDRSIPVAYEPGENHNVDRCILLRRFIE